MKKVLSVFAFLVILLSLTACSATQAAEPVTQTTANPQQTADDVKLLMGAFLLEDTDQAITPDQAGELILLWKGVKALATSDSATQAELDALYAQIEETMTPEQMTAINAMTIDQDTMRELMQQYGIGMSNGEGDASGTDFGFMMGEMPEGMEGMTLPEGGNFERPSDGGGGAMPGGGGTRPGGDMGGGFATGANLNESQRATLQAQQSNQTGTRRSAGMTLMLIDPLIQLLQERAAQ
ncbi:MAG: hypothetical protein JW987_11880 [Anaerolineaceae bacterium]|nr:hypothetical protein [Anaerolineaceae bacterium]